MKKIKYMLKCIKNLNLKNMFNIIDKLSKKTHKSKIVLTIDIIYCALRYGAGYYDYQEFEFYNLSNKERKTYLTRVKNNNIIKTYNNRADFYKLDDKGIFNETFKDYIKRDFLIIDEDNFDEFKKFTDKHKKIIAKIINGEGGKGISIVDVNKKNQKKTFEELLANKQTLIEEVIIQNEEISKLYSGSVNTLRLFTFFDGENAYVLNSVFKIGNGGVTDNFSSGSMYTFTDDDGVVIVPAIDQDDNIYEVHPITKEKIVGFKAPLYDEACKLVCEAAKLMPTIKYIGWDVAITSDTPVIIEGNSYPGVFQIKPSLTDKHIGLIPKYQKYMNIK